jgi:predicted GTPase
VAVVKLRCLHVLRVAATLAEEFAKVRVQRLLAIKVVHAQTLAVIIPCLEKTSRRSALKTTDKTLSRAMQSLVVALPSILESAMPKLTYQVDRGIECAHAAPLEMNSGAILVEVTQEKAGVMGLTSTKGFNI